MNTSFRELCFKIKSSSLIEYLNITYHWNNVMKIYVTGYVTAMVVALVAALSLSALVSTNQQAYATLTQSKNVECGGALHTQNFCDGYHLGRIDCQTGHDYRGGHSSHTKNWRDGYKAGWYGDGCRIP